MRIYVIRVESESCRHGAERTKFLAPPEPEIEIEDEEEEEDDEPWPDHPVLGAEELLRFARIRQLLQS